jgi:2-oxoglutarate ferredoxin oxidoreductase subunit beta
VHDREGAFSYIRSHPGEVLTGVIYADETVPDMHEMNNTPAHALTKVPMEKLVPGSAALAELMADFR